jgi:hypothetical protein
MNDDVAWRGASEALSSLDELLTPAALTRSLGRPVKSVRREPFEPAGWSSTDAMFQAILIDDETEPSLLSKTVRRKADWVAVATDDTVDREVRTWESGLLARLPAPATHAVVAAARSARAYSVLMHDLSPWLLPDEAETAVPRNQQLLVLDALAAMHVEFWMEESLYDTALGLNSLATFIGHTSPSTMQTVRAKVGTPPVVGYIEDGWKRLPLVSDPAFAADVQWLADDPSPLVEAAARYPWTLTHTDPRPANLAIDDAGGRVFLMDWSRPTPAPPALDLAYWLFSGNRLDGIPHDDIIDAYVARLQRRLGRRFSMKWWAPQLDLCLLAVFVTTAPFIAAFQAEAVPWWTERVRSSLRTLG